MTTEFTLIDDGHTLELSAEIADGGVTLSRETLDTALGWALEPEGLCRGNVCVPVRDRSVLERGDGVDLAAFADAVGRPLALDVEARAAALGAAAHDRTTQLESLEAPDFTLPDLAGREHTLSDYRGKKVLLIVYASW